MPECEITLADYWQIRNRVKRIEGIQPISFADIEGCKAACCKSLSPLEVAAICEMDDAYVIAVRKATSDGIRDYEARQEAKAQALRMLG